MCVYSNLLAGGSPHLSALVPPFFPTYSLLERDRKSHTAIARVRAGSTPSISDSDSINSLRTAVRVYECIGRVCMGCGIMGE